MRNALAKRRECRRRLRIAADEFFVCTLKIDVCATIGKRL